MFSQDFDRRRFHVTLPTVLALAALFILTIGHSSLTRADNQLPSAAIRNAETQTHALAAMANRYQRAAAGERAILLEQMLTTAEDRRELLAGLIEQNPGAILRVALPARVRAKMPAAVQAILEKSVEVAGELKVVYEDHDNAAHIRYSLDITGQQVALSFRNAPKGLQSGDRIRFRGVRLGDAMAVGSDESSLITLELNEDGSGGGAATSSAPLPNTFGEKRTAVFLVNFNDQPSDKPYTVTEAHDLVFGTVSDFMFENSFGQTWLSGDALGWYTLPFSQPTDSANCKSTDIAAGAQQAAQNEGVDLSAYDHYIYVFPQTPCFPSGSGTVGGSPSESWINGSWFKLKTVAHEFGHNLGLYHSGALECGATTLGDNCQTFVYGDTMDIMGNQSVGHYNGFQKERLGWLDPNLGQVESIYADGSFTLSAFEVDSDSAPKAVKVYKDIDPATGTIRWIYVEYRQAIGFDDFLGGYTNIINGIVARTGTDSAPGSSVLLDMTPSSSTTWDWGDASLAFGNAFADPATGLTIAAQWGDGSNAGFDISFGTPTCARADPLVSISPAVGPWVDPGTEVAYQVSVTNMDGDACGASDFNLRSSEQTGWITSYDIPSPNIDPGTTVTSNLTVASSTNTVDGTYDIDVMAQNSLASNHAGSVLATYVVSQSEANEPPVANNDNASTTQDTPVTIDVLANDYDPDGDPLSIVSVGQPSRGSIVIGADGTVNYSPKHKFKGEESFWYRVSDGEQTAEATVSVVVERKSGGGDTSDGSGDNGGNKGKGKPRK